MLIDILNSVSFDKELDTRYQVEPIEVHILYMHMKILKLLIDQKSASYRIRFLHQLLSNRKDISDNAQDRDLASLNGMCSMQIKQLVLNDKL